MLCAEPVLAWVREGPLLLRMVTVIFICSCCSDLWALQTFVLDLVVTASQAGLQGWWLGDTEAQGRAPSLGVARAAVANHLELFSLPWHISLDSAIKCLETLALGSQVWGEGLPRA